MSHRPIDNLAKAKHYQVTKLNHGPDAEMGAYAPEQLAAKTNPLSISKRPEIQAVLHPLLADDLLPRCSRGHARRVILRTKKIQLKATRQPNRQDR